MKGTLAYLQLQQLQRYCHAPKTEEQKGEQSYVFKDKETSGAILLTLIELNSPGDVEVVGKKEAWNTILFITVLPGDGMSAFLPGLDNIYYITEKFGTLLPCLELE